MTDYGCLANDILGELHRFLLLKLNMLDSGEFTLRRSGDQPGMEIVGNAG